MNEILSSSFDDSGEANTDGMQELDWFGITDEDRRRVVGLRGLVEEHIDDIMDGFLKQSGGIETGREHRVRGLHADSIRDEQRRHFLDLFRDVDAEQSGEARDRTGSFNERAGLSTIYYMGMFAYVLDRVSELVRANVADREEANDTIASLFRMASCQKAVTLDAFAQARERRVEDRERELSELPTPVLRLRDGLLLVPVVGTLDSYRARELTVQMLDAIREFSASAVVLDITGVQAVDSAVANHLVQTMTAARLMGASCVLTGITAEVAQSLVKIGVTGAQLNPAGDLQRGIATAERLMGV